MNFNICPMCLNHEDYMGEICPIVFFRTNPYDANFEGTAYQIQIETEEKMIFIYRMHEIPPIHKISYKIFSYFVPADFATVQSLDKKLDLLLTFGQ